MLPEHTVEVSIENTALEIQKGLIPKSMRMFGFPLMRVGWISLIGGTCVRIPDNIAPRISHRSADE